MNPVTEICSPTPSLHLKNTGEKIDRNPCFIRKFSDPCNEVWNLKDRRITRTCSSNSFSGNESSKDFCSPNRKMSDLLKRDLLTDAFLEQEFSYFTPRKKMGTTTSEGIKNSPLQKTLSDRLDNIKDEQFLEITLKDIDSIYYSQVSIDEKSSERIYTDSKKGWILDKSFALEVLWVPKENLFISWGNRRLFALKAHAKDVDEMSLADAHEQCNLRTGKTPQKDIDVKEDTIQVNAPSPKGEGF